MGQQLKIGDRVIVSYKSFFVDIKNETGTIAESGLADVDTVRVILDRVRKTIIGHGTISRLLVSRKDVTLLNSEGNTDWASLWDNN